MLRSSNTSLQQAKFRLMNSKSPPDNDELRKSDSTFFVHNVNKRTKIDDQMKLLEARGKLAASQPEPSYIRLRPTGQKELGASSNVSLPEQTTDIDVDSKALVWNTIQEIQQFSEINMNTTLSTDFPPYPMTQIPNEQIFLANLNLIPSHQSKPTLHSELTVESSLDAEANIPRERSARTRKRIDFERFKKAEEERKQALQRLPVDDVLQSAGHAKDASIERSQRKSKPRKREMLVMPTKSKSKPMKQAQIGKNEESVLSKMNRFLELNAATDLQDLKIERSVKVDTQASPKEKEEALKRYYQIKESSVCLIEECQPFFSPISTIAFAKPVRSQFGVIIKCIDGCTFQQTFKGINYMRETMSSHFTEHHQRQKWNGFCSTCLKYIFNPDKDESRRKFSMVNEIDHILNFHVGSKRQA